MQDYSTEKLRPKIAKAESLVNRLGTGDKGPAYAVAVERLVDLRTSLAEDEAVDADEIVRLAEDAHRAAPSMATYGPLIKTLMYRAGKKLAAEYPEYAKATQGTGRAAPVRCTVALAMARTDALGRSARENKDVQRGHRAWPLQGEAFPADPRFLGVGRPGGCRAQPGRPAGKVPDTRRTRRDPTPDRPMPVSDQPP